MSVNVKRCFGIILTLILLCPVALTSAQLIPGMGDDADEPEAPIHLEMDLMAMLTADDVLANKSADAIWTVEPTAGRRLVQIPVNVEPGDRDFRLNSGTLNMRGARFLCYRIVDNPDRSNEGTMRSREIEEKLSDLPMITRELIVTPSGRIKWELDRFIPNGDVKKSTRLYAYKVDRQLLQDKHPGPPPRFSRNRGEDERKFNIRRREALSRYRAKAEEYRELVSAVNDLPTEFESDLPDRIWAVFEVFGHTDEFAITGPEPLPWSLSYSQLELLRRTAGRQINSRSGPGENFALPRDLLEEVSAMQRLVNSRHPYSLRISAYAIALGNVPEWARTNNVVYQLLDMILKSDDAVARRVVVKELVTMVPPTSATAALLRQAARDMTPESQLLSLKGLLRADTSDPTKMQNMLNTANRILADPAGPPAGDVVLELLNSIQQQPQALRALQAGVRFDALPDERKRQAITAIIEAAPNDDLAAAWLNRPLLDLTRPDLAKTTLELLATGTHAGDRVREMTGAVMTVLFGRPDPQRQTAAGPVLEGTIPVSGGSHNLFNGLQAGDLEIRDLAWRSLQHFHITSEASTESGPFQSSAYDAVLDAALAQRPTPVAAVEFLGRQDNTGRATAALVYLTINADSRAASRAAEMLLQRDESVAGILARLSPGDREGFAQRIYQLVTGSAPYEVGLMRYRSENSPIVPWFGKEIGEGRLPRPSEWGPAFGGEDRLLELINSTDETLALAAASAMITSSGGDPRMARRLANSLRSLEDKTLATLKDKWNEARQEILMEQMRKATGAYEMVLRQFTPGQRGPDRADRSLEREVSVGVVQLSMDQMSPQLAGGSIETSIPGDYLALRLRSAGQVKSLAAAKLDDWSIEEVGQIDLRPQDDGSWVGETNLGNRAVLQIQLTPAG